MIENWDGEKMQRSDSLVRKLENITYFMELVRDEIERAVEDTFLEYTTESCPRLEIKDTEEEDGAILEGFTVTLDDSEGIVIEFADGSSHPLHSLETDNMYDMFVRIHSALLEDTAECN